MLNWKQTLLRALKTFVQVFGATMPLSFIQWFDLDIVKTGLIASSSAAFSIIWNRIMTWAHSINENESE